MHTTGVTSCFLVQTLAVTGIKHAAHRASEVGVAELIGHRLRRDAADAEPDPELQVEHQVIRAVSLVDALTWLPRDLRLDQRKLIQV